MSEKHQENQYRLYNIDGMSHKGLGRCKKRDIDIHKVQNDSHCHGYGQCPILQNVEYSLLIHYGETNLPAQSERKGFATPAIDRLRFANPLYGLIPLPSYRKKHIRCINYLQFPVQRGLICLKKSLPLLSTRMNAGKSSTSIFQIASIPSSGYSTHSMLLMLF